MTLFHISPKTGKSARCRATIRCRYGATTGSITTKDGTTITGTAGEDIEFIGGNPTVRPTTKKPYGLRKKKVEEDSTTDPHATLVNNMTEGYSARGNLEGDSIEEFARKAAVPRLEAEKLHEMKKRDIQKEELRKEELEKARLEREEKARQRKESGKNRKKLSPKQKKKLKKQREKERWQKMSRSEKMREIVSWKEQKKRNANNSTTRKTQKNTMFHNIDQWVNEQKSRGKSTDDALNALLGGGSF